MTSSPIRHGTPAYYRFGIILGSLVAMGPLAIDMYLPSFPTIARELGATVSEVEVTSAVYFAGLALGQGIYGPITDRLGRTRPLFFGMILFIAASVGCAYATSVPALIGFRLAQALGGCAEMVVARAMVRDFFDERDSMRVLSLLFLVMGLAPILAPLIGGQLLVRFGWRSVFVVLAAYCMATLIAVVALLPESLPVDRRRRESPAAILGVFGTLLSDATFMAYVIAGSLILGGMFAYIAGSPGVFIEYFGVPADRFGFLFGTNAFGLIAASQINGRLARTVDARTILRRVLLVAGLAGGVLLFDAMTGAGGLLGILVPLFVCVASVGLIVPNTVVLAMAPHGRVAGTASALVGVLQFGCGAAAAGAVSRFSNGTPVPLAAVVAICAVGGLIAFQLCPADRG